jgi:predicted RNase H-like nuclease (RuvC/YqgF family)
MGGSIVGKNKEDIFNDERESDIIEPQDSTVEEYDMKLERMEEEVKKLKKIKKRQKKIKELEFEQKDILRKMDKNSKKGR